MLAAGTDYSFRGLRRSSAVESKMSRFPAELEDYGQLLRHDTFILETEFLAKCEDCLTKVSFSFLNLFESIGGQLDDVLCILRKNCI